MAPAGPRRRAGTGVRRCTRCRSASSAETVTPTASSSALKRIAPSPTARQDPGASAATSARRSGGQADGRQELRRRRRRRRRRRPRRGGRRGWPGRGRRARGRRRARARGACESATVSTVQALRQRAGGRDADAQAGERAGPDAGADPGEVAPRGARLGQRGVRERQQLRGVAGLLARARIVAALGQQRAVGRGDADDRGRRGGVEGENHLDDDDRDPPIAAGVLEQHAGGDALQLRLGDGSGHSTKAIASGVR